MKRRREKNKTAWIKIWLAVFCLASVLFCGTTADAASAKVPKKARTYVGFQHSTKISIDYTAKDTTIKNLKSGSKNLVAIVTSEEYNTHRKNGYTTITMYAKKAGTYKLSFDIYNGKKKKSSHTVTVYASKYTGNWKVDNQYILLKEIQSPVWDMVNVLPCCYTQKTSAKISYVVPKGCKLLSLKKVYRKGDKRISSKIKNGKKVAFNRTAPGNSAAFTYFYVKYKDTYKNCVVEDYLAIGCPAK